MHKRQADAISIRSVWKWEMENELKGRYKSNLTNHHLHNGEQKHCETAIKRGCVGMRAETNEKVCRVHGGRTVHLPRIHIWEDIVAFSQCRHAIEGAHHLSTYYLLWLLNKQRNVPFPFPAVRCFPRLPASHDDCIRYGSLYIDVPPRSSQETAGSDQSTVTITSVVAPITLPG